MSHQSSFALRTHGGLCAGERWIYDGDEPIAQLIDALVEQPEQNLRYFNAILKPVELRNLKLKPGGRHRPTHIRIRLQLGLRHPPRRPLHPRRTLPAHLPPIPHPPLSRRKSPGHDAGRWDQGTSYRVSCYIKTENVAGRGSFLAVRWIIDNHPDRHPYICSQKLIGTHDWTRVEVEIPGPPPRL